MRVLQQIQEHSNCGPVNLLVLLGDLLVFVRHSHDPLTGRSWGSIDLHLGHEMPELLAQLGDEVRLSDPRALAVGRNLDRATQVIR